MTALHVTTQSPVSGWRAVTDLRHYHRVSVSKPSNRVQDVLVIGTGGFARETAEAVRAVNAV
jgi:hypothetical protein